MPHSGPAAQPWRRQRPTAFVGSEGPLAAPGLHTAWFHPQNRLLVLLAPGKGPEGRLVAAEAGRKAGEVSRTRWGRQRMENKSVVHPPWAEQPRTS